MTKKLFSFALAALLISAPLATHAGFFDIFKFRSNLQAALGLVDISNAAKFGGYEMGDKGGSIAEAQTKLRELGYFNQKESSGHFDLDTKVAVMAFQKDERIAVSGTLDRETMAALISADDRGGSGFEIQVKALLGGAYNTSTGIMNSTLNDTGLIPFVEPYTGLGYGFIGGGEEETTTSVFNVVGNNAIVDWVVLELRNPTNIYETIYSRAALIQADGDIVDVDGVSPVSVETNFSEYYVAVMHRNHLGVISAHWFGTSEAVDLTSNNDLYGGSSAAKLVAPNKYALWPGDINADTKVKYTGSGNDRDELLYFIGSTMPNNVVSGYLSADVNLDGVAKYTGAGNDRDVILQQVGGSTPNNVIGSELPENACMMSEFVSNESTALSSTIQFDITFDITATSAEDCGGISVDSSTENNNGVDVNGQGVTYTVGTSIQTPSVVAALVCIMGCESVAGGYMVEEGETGRFKLTIVASSLAHGEFYGASMHSINWRNGSIATNADKFYRANLGYTSVYSSQPVFYP